MSLKPSDFLRTAPRQVLNAWNARKGLAHRRVRNMFQRLDSGEPRPGPNAGVKRWARYLRRS